MTERNPDDIDLDQIMEMIDDNDNDGEATSIHQQSPEEKIEVEQREPRAVRDEPTQDSGDAKLVYETLNSNLALKQEVERLRGEKEEAERMALQSVLRSFETQIDSSQNDIGRLKQELVRARDEGDTAASVEIESRIREQHDQMRDLKSKVDQYSPILNQPRRAQEQQQHQAPVQTDGNKMAAEWLRENETWLTDPRNTEKRDYANNLFKEMQTNRMDMNSLTFWTKFEKQLADYDHKKSSSNQQQRMPKNMVTYNSNGSSANSSRPTSYKQNPEFVHKVAFLAKNVIKNEDLLKDEKMLNSMLKHYHKVYRAGNFKYLPQSAE